MKKYMMFSFILLAFNLYAQRKITGIVTDGNKEFIPFLSIGIKGTNKGTSTDVDGRYSIDIDGEAKALIFSYIGSIKQEIIIGQSDTINVKMQEDSTFGGKIDVQVISGNGCIRSTIYRPHLNVPTYYTMIGFVKDANGKPLESVLISHKNSKKTTSTDAKGIYSIKIFEEHGGKPVFLEKTNSVFTFSYIDLKTKEISVGKENIDAELDEGTALENSDSKEKIGDLAVGIRNVFMVKVYLATVILDN
jgi:CarboxypepD_reg-like domain